MKFGGIFNAVLLLNFNKDNSKEVFIYGQRFKNS